MTDESINWLKEVTDHKADLLKDLERLLQIESIKDRDTASPSQPMGAKVAEALQYMLQLADEQQFHTKNHGGYYGIAQYGNHSSDEYIGILCHVDVVPATGEWDSLPFSPTIKDGRLIARGAIDDKGPTMAAFYGLKIVKALGIPLKRNVRLIFGTDEESGMSCLKTYRDVEKPPIAGFAPDAVFPVINAEKGQIHAIIKLDSSNIRSQRGQLQLESFQAGTRANMVPEKAKAVLKGTKDKLQIVADQFNTYLSDERLPGNSQLIEGSQDEYELTLSLAGKSAHSMEPYKGINAAVKLAVFLSQQDLGAEANTYFRCINQYFHNDHFGEALGINFEDDISGKLTVNPAIFNYPSIHLNIRFPVSAKYEDIEKALSDKTIANHFVIDTIRHKKPHYVDGHQPMIKALQHAYESITGEEPTLLSTGGNTYASLIPNCVAFGAVFPGKIMTAHQQNEYIEVDDLLKATAIYAKAIVELANME